VLTTKTLGILSQIWAGEIGSLNSDRRGRGRGLDLSRDVSLPEVIVRSRDWTSPAMDSIGKNIPLEGAVRDIQPLSPQSQ